VRARGTLTAGGLAVALAAAVALAIPPAGARAGSGVPAGISVPARVVAPHAEVASAATGRVLWAWGSGTPVPMGSITKVMTAYVVIEAGNLDRRITVPKEITAYDRKYGGSTAGLRPGESLTARELLYAMLIPSGCDAAYTLAQAYGPGQQGFLARMNAAAASLRLAHTRFTDPSGLPVPSGTSTFSTAADLVTLGRYAMRLPLFASIVGTASYSVPRAAGDHPAFTWRTTNPLLGEYPGVTGIKTGDTDAAGDCLLFEAVRGGVPVIGVVLGEKSWQAAVADAGSLLNYGFASS
jgi:D-alanyl-D-alanine carboxypeptidase (penicillin-binding protein 5/6)